MSHDLPAKLDIGRMVELLKVLAEPNRLIILNMLMNGVQCNCDLGEALQMAPNLISHHLGVLRQAGLVDVQRDMMDARWNYYTVNSSALDEICSVVNIFFDAERIKPRKKSCGPKKLSFSIQSVLEK